MESVTHCVSSLREQRITAKLVWKNRSIERRTRGCLRPLGISYSVLVAPAHRYFRLILPRGFGSLISVDDVFKHITSMVEHNVKDHVDSQTMSFIDQTA